MGRTEAGKIGWKSLNQTAIGRKSAQVDAQVNFRFAPRLGSVTLSLWSALPASNGPLHCQDRYPSLTLRPGPSRVGPFFGQQVGRGSAGCKANTAKSFDFPVAGPDKGRTRTNFGGRVLCNLPNWCSSWRWSYRWLAAPIHRARISNAGWSGRRQVRLSLTSPAAMPPPARLLAGLAEWSATTWASVAENLRTARQDRDQAGKINAIRNESPGGVFVGARI